MNSKWHCVRNQREEGPREYSAQAVPEQDSPWFNGHFPGMPILPGVAQLAMVGDLLKWHAKESGGDIVISSLSRVRFRQLIRPGDDLAVTLTQDADDPSGFRFRITAKGQLACSGQLRTAVRAA